MHVTTLRHTPAAGWSAPLPEVDPSRTLVLCFGATGYQDDAEPIRELATSVGASLIGCSTAGEIFGPAVVDETLTVAVAEFEATGLQVVAEPISAYSSFDAGVAVARRLAEDDLKAVFVLSDGLDVNGTDLVRGINTIVPPSVVVSGGLAADGSRFERTWVVVDGKPIPGFVTASGGSLLAGEENVAFGVGTHGPIRTPVVDAKSDDNGEVLESARPYSNARSRSENGSASLPSPGPGRELST